MNMYCPICFNNTLKVSSRGVVHLVINGKKMDSGRFLFNFDDMTKDEILQSFIEKLESFFKWYSNFNNQDPIAVVELYTNDISCMDSCKIPIGHFVSVIDLLIDKKTLKELLNEQADKYQLTIEVKNEEEK
jgi:hypothetical protein